MPRSGSIQNGLIRFGKSYSVHHADVFHYHESDVMGVSKGQVAWNEHAIITAAARQLRERGVDDLGLIELMREAGFTQAGFCNHFKSKHVLLAEVVATAITGASARLGQAIVPIAHS
jgi:hypothetical protein